MPVALYTLGTAQRPQLSHDPGFADCSRPVSASDLVLFAGWSVALEGAEAVQGVPRVPKSNMPDALAAYRHFLYGAGKTRTFSYDRYVANDSSGRVTLENAISDIQDGIEYLSSKNPYSAGFEVTGTGIRCEKDNIWSHKYPYPETENWQKAIGAHWIWLSAVVGVNRGTPRDFVATVTLHAEDLYNFNPGDEDIATGIPDAMNGRLEESCLGREFLSVSTLSRVVRWQERAPQAATIDQSSSGRHRMPQDNLRPRNRL